MLEIPYIVTSLYEISVCNFLKICMMKILIGRKIHVQITTPLANGGDDHPNSRLIYRTLEEGDEP